MIGVTAPGERNYNRLDSIATFHEAMAKNCSKHLIRRSLGYVRSLGQPGMCIAVLRAYRGYRDAHCDLEELEPCHVDHPAVLRSLKARVTIQETAFNISRILEGWRPRPGQDEYEQYAMTGYFWPLTEEFTEQRVEALSVAGRIMEAIERAANRPLN